jgi:hypothetical protein
MDRRKINRICAFMPVILSWTACIWVLGNVAGGTAGGEGLGFHIFWLLILVQGPFVIGYLLTADRRRGAFGLAVQLAALVLAFAPVAYFRL